MLLHLYQPTKSGMKELGIATELGKARPTRVVMYPGVDQVSKLFFNLFVFLFLSIACT